MNGFLYWCMKGEAGMEERGRVNSLIQGIGYRVRGTGTRVEATVCIKPACHDP
jgi:hypothetical protein